MPSDPRRPAGPPPAVPRQARPEHADDLLNVLVSQSPVGVAVTDREHRYVRVNALLASMHGVPVEGHTARRVQDVLPRAAPAIVAALDQVLRTGAPVDAGEAQLDTPGGSGRPRRVHFRFQPYHRQGHLAGVVTFVEDVTDRVQAKESARQAEESARQAVRREMAGARVAAALAEGGLNLRQAAERIAACVADVIEDLCVVLALDDETGHIQPLAVAATDPLIAAGIIGHLDRNPPSTMLGPVARALRSGQMQRLSHANPWAFAHGAGPRYDAFLERHPLHSTVLAPIRAQGSTIGVLGCSRHAPRARFGDEDVAFVQDLADRAGMALANATLFAEQERTSRELQRLLHVSESMLGQPTLDSLLDKLLPCLARVLEADTVRLLVTDSDGKHLGEGGTYGFSDSEATAGRIPIGQGVAGHIAATRKPLFVADLDQMEVASQPLRESGVRSLAGVPLLAGEHLVGVLHVGSKTPRAFSRQDVALLERAADRIAVAVREAHVEQLLRVVEAKARAVLAAAPDAILTIDEHGVVDSMNQAGLDLFGYKPGEVLGQNVSMLMPEPHRSQHDGYLDAYRKTGTRHVIGIRRETQAQRRDGSVFPAEIHVSEVRVGSVMMFAGVLRDISERRAAEQELRRHALHDSLTGLANRVLFRDHLKRALARRSRRGNTVSILFLDLDRFKVVNDSLGHAAGDHLLVQVADRLRQAVRPEDTIARLGGDEFAVLVEDVDLETVARIARRILQLFGDPFVVESEEVSTATSIGIALSDGIQSAGDLLRHADAALYLAKDRGRNRYAVFDEPLRRSIQDRVRTENDLRRALVRGEMDVYYQPQLSLNGRRRVERVEALLRWHHPTRGLLPAAEFIGLAEETGLIVPIGAKVVEMAGRQQVAWRDQFGDAAPDVAVNLSPQQLALSNVAAVIESSGVLPEKLWIELTESTLMADLPRTAQRLGELKRLGVRIAVDDFGTGHSSLAYLRRFPIDAVKIDRTFVDGIGVDPDDTAIVTAILSLGHTLHVEVVAEGVEDTRQLRVLQDLGCDFVQGNLISPALPAAELTRMLERSA